MISSGPRSGFFASTLASVQGLKLAAAAWKIGSPDPGTEYSSYNCLASSSLTALAKLYRNCSNVSGIARWRFVGLPSTGLAARNAEIGSGSTPRNGAGLIATDTDAR